MEIWIQRKWKRQVIEHRMFSIPILGINHTSMSFDNIIYIISFKKHSNVNIKVFWINEKAMIIDKLWNSRDVHVILLNQMF
jgi:hypothetical protein